jgi:hypothetical protein
MTLALNETTHRHEHAADGGRDGRDGPGFAAMAAIAAIIVQFALVAAYAWTAASTAPRNLPVAITGPQPAVAQVTGEIEDARPGAFKLISVASTAQAEADIRGRLTYGAITLESAGRPEVLIASGASPAVASVLTELASRLDGAPARPANVRDIVPVSPADTTGAAFAFTVLPLMLGSLVAGVLFSVHVRRTRYRALGLAGFGIGGGAAIAGVSHTWLGIVPGHFAALWAVLGLASLAGAAAVSGLAQIGARYGKMMAGIGAGGVMIMLLGNPFSGMSSAPEMLPGAWGVIGQCLPTGAAATLLRSVAYFGGTRSAGAWTVLAIWAGAGILLTLSVQAARGSHDIPS